MNRHAICQLNSPFGQLRAIHTPDGTYLAGTDVARMVGLKDPSHVVSAATSGPYVMVKEGLGACNPTRFIGSQDVECVLEKSRLAPDILASIRAWLEREVFATGTKRAGLGQAPASEDAASSNVWGALTAELERENAILESRTEQLRQLLDKNQQLRAQVAALLNRLREGGFDI